MKTDQLIDILSSNLEPVDQSRAQRALRIALAIGGGLAVALIAVALGMRTDLEETGAVLFLVLKLAFTLGVVALATAHLRKLVRPGGERETPLVYASLPLLVVIVLAAVALASAPSSHWHGLIMGNHWVDSLISIPLVAVVPFAALVWAIRRGAPTNLAKAGAVAGLLAGGISATAYSLNCTDDSLPFIAVWYGGTLAICTLAGAALGPRLLRW